MTAAKKRVVVIGAGIVGASIAYHLARGGAAVTVVERARAAGAATGKSFAWLNASLGNPRHYYALRLQSLLEWHRLEGALDGALAVKWGGSLMWEDDMAAFATAVRAHRAWGYPIRMVGREEFRRLEPHVAEPPEGAAFAACEGSVAPVAATRALLDAAGARGAVVVEGREVRGWRTRNGRVVGVETADGAIAADHVVLAAGTASQALARGLGVPLAMANSPGLLIHTEPAAPLLDRLVLAPGLHIKQDPGGAIVAGADFGGGAAPDDPRKEARRLLARLRARLIGGEALALAAVTVGERVIPEGGLPVIGQPPGLAGLHLAVMHSGVTLAPLVGRLVADEVLDGVTADLLAPFRPLAPTMR